jgi:predicted nucleic acid-binding protein
VILVDTNVVSETSKRNPNANVIHWLAENEALLHLPAFAIAEMRYGVEKMELSPQRFALEDWLSRLIRRFEPRILPFDQPAAEAHGRLRAHLKRTGKPIDAPDTYIAAIALARQLPIATRNTKDFEWTGVRLVNPWAAEG